MVRNVNAIKYIYILVAVNILVYQQIKKNTYMLAYVLPRLTITFFVPDCNLVIYPCTITLYYTSINTLSYEPGK